MADTFTTNYDLTKPQVGASRDTWGNKMNDNLDAIDAAIDAAKDQAAAALPKAGGTVTGEVINGGAFLHFVAAALASGRVFLSPAAGADPRTLLGDVWLGY